MFSIIIMILQVMEGATFDQLLTEMMYSDLLISFLRGNHGYIWV